MLARRIGELGEIFVAPVQRVVERAFLELEVVPRIEQNDIFTRIESALEFTGSHERRGRIDRINACLPKGHDLALQLDFDALEWHLVAPAFLDVKIGKAWVVVHHREKASHGRLSAGEEHVDAFPRDQYGAFEPNCFGFGQPFAFERCGIVDGDESIRRYIQNSGHGSILSGPLQHAARR